MNDQRPQGRHSKNVRVFRCLEIFLLFSIVFEVPFAHSQDGTLPEGRSQASADATAELPELPGKVDVDPIADDADIAEEQALSPQQRQDATKEDEAAANSAEGDLASEADDIEQQARQSRLP